MIRSLRLRRRLVGARVWIDGRVGVVLDAAHPRRCAPMLLVELGGGFGRLWVGFSEVEQVASAERDLLFALDEALTVPRAAVLEDVTEEQELLRQRLSYARSVITLALRGRAADQLAAGLRERTARLPVTYRSADR